LAAARGVVGKAVSSGPDGVSSGESRKSTTTTLTPVPRPANERKHIMKKIVLVLLAGTCLAAFVGCADSTKSTTTTSTTEQSSYHSEK
jgi:hypothetical protein